MYKKLRRDMKFKHRNHMTCWNKPYLIKMDEERDSDLQTLDVEWGEFLNRIDEMTADETRKVEKLRGGGSSTPTPGKGGESKSAETPAS